MFSLVTHLQFEHVLAARRPLPQAPTAANAAQDSSVKAALAASKNIFDAARKKHKKAAAPTNDELEHYLSTEPDPMIENTLHWWCAPEWQAMYLKLSCMVRCYLTIPGELCPCCMGCF